MKTRFTSLGDGKHYFIGENTEITIPAGIEIFMPFGIFFLVFAAIKILILFKSYHDKKFEFDGKTGIVKISCIFEILGLAVITYVFFWMQINKVAIFANTVEPSLFYYLGFLLPLVFLNISFTFLYCSGADYEVSSIPVLHTQHSNVKHCQKCGAPINNSAALCEDCSGEKSAEQTYAAYTSPLPIRAYNPAIAKGRTLIIATGVACSVVRTLSADVQSYRARLK